MSSDLIDNRFPPPEGLLHAADTFLNHTVTPAKAGAALRLTRIHLQIVLLTCAKSILPSTFLRAAIAERFMLASQARCGSVSGTTGTGASMGSLPNMR